MDSVSFNDLERLFRQFCETAYQATEKSPVALDVAEKCEALFAQDYNFCVLNNDAGVLSSSYPARIIILKGEKSSETSDVCDEKLQDGVPKLKRLVINARNSRSRTRFPVPVILYEGKNICRSSTLSCAKEYFSREVKDFCTTAFQGPPEQSDSGNEEETAAPKSGILQDDRLADIKLLDWLSVKHICDLMVEKAKVKLGWAVTSSEKIEEVTYRNFNILCLPYPGCEHFAYFRDKQYSAVGLVFDWGQDYVDSGLHLPSDTLVYFANRGIELIDYRDWDLVTLTQNYIRVLLRYITEGTSGILVHCISGWDRTPLFISLLRLSLWADGKIHTSLTPLEILYLTLGYDWYLFGHHLPDRLKRGEEILCFCFYFLKFLVGEEFSISKRKDLKHSQNPLDPQLEVLREESYTGLSSKSSSISNISQDSLPPSYFSVHSRESSPINNGNAPIMKDCLSTKPENLLSDNLNSSNTLSQPLIDFYSSLPVPVPTTRRRTDSTSSTGFGSWQIITGAGSVRGSESSRSSVSSPPPEVNQNVSLDKLSMNQTGTVLNLPLPRSLREERLESVRTFFHKVYVTMFGEKCGNPAETGTFATFYNLLAPAELVGISTAKTAE